MPPPALEVPEADLDGQLPFVRPLPHVAVLQDELPHLFQDDYVGAQEEAAAVEARGEHTLLEKFGAGGPSCGALLSGTAAQPPPALGSRLHSVVVGGVVLSLAGPRGP